MEILWKLIDSAGAPITGGAASTSVKIRRASDGYLFDFNDTTFKASDWIAISSAMSEVSATHLPGVYRLLVTTTAWTDGAYQMDASYTGTAAQTALQELLLQDGIDITLAIAERTNRLPDDPASQSSVTALGTPLQAGSYVAPANSDISAIKGKTDNLPSDPASNTQVNTRLAASAYIAPDNAAIAVIGADTHELLLDIATVDGKTDQLISDVYDLTHNEAGDPISRVIPLPVASDTCVLYEYCYDVSSQTPLASVTALCQIIRLPYDYSDKLHTGSLITGTYTAADGLVQWEIVQGATVTVTIQEVGVSAVVTIPTTLQARVYDLLL